jgi:hypothetical protein
VDVFDKLIMPTGPLIAMHDGVSRRGNHRCHARA